MKEIKKGLDQLKDKHPNFVDMASKEVFRPTNPKSVADPLPRRAWTKGQRSIALMQKPQECRIAYRACEYLHLRAAIQRIS